jgi:hypothetical protein
MVKKFADGSKGATTGARTFFRQFVEAHLVAAPGEFKTLPLAHGTKTIFIRDILAAGHLALPSEPCPTLHQKLIFSFYGRPSYRVNPDAGALKRPAGAPSYILLKPRAFEAAAMAHPLDTGAFKLELYEAQVEQALSALDFGFGPDIGDIKKVIYYFFGSNESYMSNLPRDGLNVPYGHDEAQAYYDVISNGHGSKRDERDSSIEITLSRKIPVEPDWIQCLILPDLVIDAENYGVRAQELGIDVRAYRFTSGFSSKDYTGRIFDAVIDYYRAKDIL